MKFNLFQKAVEKQFNEMTSNHRPLFVTDFDRDDIYYETYLKSFPEGTNPLHITNTVHDCNCCKNFIRRLGGVVTINDDLTLNTIWDITVAGYYQEVADAMSAYVKSRAIKNQFMSDIRNIGHKMNVGMTESGETVEYEHFFIQLPTRFVLKNGQSYGDFAGDKLADAQVLERSLKEFTVESIEVVIDLIDQGSLYRGSEKFELVKKIAKYKRDYDIFTDIGFKNAFIWETAAKLKGAGRFRNDVIGTLIADLSDGVDLEKAVKSFEAKVAPTNYKRSSALITQSMITSAEETVKELGLENALQRRFANVHDITINNVLFADRTAKESMGLFNLTPTKASTAKIDKIEEIGIDDFLQNVLPKIDSMEVQMQSGQTNNLMSVVAPESLDANNMLKWDNNFSWSYNGEVTDSIKERVKTAGGNVTGEVRCSLAWYNPDDLDLSVKCPGTRSNIYFGHRRSCGGQLDVDMNNEKHNATDPVENITWERVADMVEGDYTVVVHNYSKRLSDREGFEIEMEILGKTVTIRHPKKIANNQKITVLTFNYSKKDGVVITESLDATTVQKTVWGVTTNAWSKVSMIMDSPNHWDGQKLGNKHTFFILEDCINPDPVRGFYNEFLSGELSKHRKVFEVLSSKFKTQHTENQLSGLGFSSTQRNNLLVRVKGSFNRILKINF